MKQGNNIEVNRLADYANWVEQLKAKILSARTKAALSVNARLIELYWDLGKELSEKSSASEWGSGIIEKISLDLRREFPEMKGFSRRNLYAMKQWYEFYQARYKLVPQAVAQIPWAGRFRPEYAGKLNFYLSAVDSQLKKPEDNPGIGILLCKKKDKIEAEYALRDINKPMGISEYKLTQAIPEEIKTQLPSIEEIEFDLNRKLVKVKGR